MHVSQNGYQIENSISSAKNSSGFLHRRADESFTFKILYKEEFRIPPPAPWWKKTPPHTLP